ncbi:L,D-transpeptidase [Yoonia maritima]|uniref:L,D-transpeptidase n=1 Tax=Yoonia maritima TaxID=1435347 RepID=UPI002435AD16|nr:L,D-transpeptidase [Yoonia maritima]
MGFDCARPFRLSPGDSIMIHGILNGWGWLGPLQTYLNWTNGCIAVNNEQMREIWSLVPNGTPITIQE